MNRLSTLPHPKNSLYRSTSSPSNRSPWSSVNGSKGSSKKTSNRPGCISALVTFGQGLLFTIAGAVSRRTATPVVTALAATTAVTAIPALTASEAPTTLPVSVPSMPTVAAAPVAIPMVVPAATEPTATFPALTAIMLTTAVSL